MNWSIPDLFGYPRRSLLSQEVVGVVAQAVSAQDEVKGAGMQGLGTKEGMWRGKGPAEMEASDVML